MKQSNILVADDDVMPHDLNIFVFDDMPHDLCDRLIAFIEKNIDSFEYEQERIGLYNAHAFGRHLSLMVSANVPDAADLDRELFQMYNNYVRQIVEQCGVRLTVDSDSGYNLRKFVGGTDEHIDGLDYDQPNHAVRCLTAVTYLNDDFDGGELVFPVQGETVIAKKGRTVFFPPYWTHPHYARKVSAPRYTVNTWFYQSL